MNIMHPPNGVCRDLHSEVELRVQRKRLINEVIVMSPKCRLYDRIVKWVRGDWNKLPFLPKTVDPDLK